MLTCNGRHVFIGYRLCRCARWNQTLRQHLTLLPVDRYPRSCTHVLVLFRFDAFLIFVFFPAVFIASWRLLSCLVNAC